MASPRRWHISLGNAASSVTAGQRLKKKQQSKRKACPDPADQREPKSLLRAAKETERRYKDQYAHS